MTGEHDEDDGGCEKLMRVTFDKAAFVVGDFSLNKKRTEGRPIFHYFSPTFHLR